MPSRTTSTGKWPASWMSRATGRVGPWCSSRPANTRSSAWAVPRACACRPGTDRHTYELTSYADLYAVPVDGSGEQAAFFDLGNGGKVRGAERKKEKFLMSFPGVDAAGQPRADDQIKMHFDQSTWGDPTIYGKYPASAAGHTVIPRAQAPLGHALPRSFASRPEDLKAS